MRKIKNLYIGDLYNRRYYSKFNFETGEPINIEYSLIEFGTRYLYKRKNGDYIIANDMIDKPFSNIKLHLLDVVGLAKSVPSIELSMVSEPTEENGKYGTLGNFIAKESIKRLK